MQRCIKFLPTISALNHQGNDQQRKEPLISKQILLVSTLGNVPTPPLTQQQ